MGTVVTARDAAILARIGHRRARHAPRTEATRAISTIGARKAGLGNHLAGQEGVVLIDTGIKHRNGLASTSVARRPGRRGANDRVALIQQRRHWFVALDANDLRCSGKSPQCRCVNAQRKGRDDRVGTSNRCREPNQTTAYCVLGLRNRTTLSRDSRRSSKVILRLSGDG